MRRLRTAFARKLVPDMPDPIAFQRLQEQLACTQANEAILRTITDNVPVLIGYVDNELRFKFVNAVFEEWIGPAPEEMVGRRIHDIAAHAPASDAPAIIGHLSQVLEESKRVEFELTTNYGGVERCLHHVFLPQLGPDGGMLGIFLLASDVTPLKNVQRQLSEMARIDTLTGLPNRFQLNERLEEMVQYCNPLSLPMGLIFLDIDSFKQVNDTLGHWAGDEVLRAVAAVFRASARPIDMVARLSGDEFVIVFEAPADRSVIEMVAEKILLAMRTPLTLSHGKHLVSSSIGAAFAVGPDIVPQLLLEYADRALYDAKRAGRGTYRICDCPSAAPALELDPPC